MKTRFSLALVSTIWITIAAGAAMGINALEEHLGQGTPLGSLATQHAVHMASLAAVTYLVLWVGFQRVVAAPLRQLAADLYRVGAGRIEPVAVDTHVREVGEIAGGVNLMIRRMVFHLPRQPLDAAQKSLTTLRATARALPPAANEQARQILAIVADLQSELAALVQAAAPARGEVSPRPDGRHPVIADNTL